MSKATKTYAILGSTGNTGTALIRTILQSSDNRINAYCRNRQKLERLLPDVTKNERLQVFIGHMGDTDLIANCLRETTAVFIVLNTNDNIPGCSLSQDSTKTVVAALEKLKSTSPPGLRMPKIVLLSSASCSKHFDRATPWLVRKLLSVALSNLYRDLELAEEYLRSQEDWLSTIYIKPGALSVDIARGHKLSLEEVGGVTSYADLAGAMIEAADDELGTYISQDVSVMPCIKGDSAKFPSGTPYALFFGLLRHLFPWLHPYLPNAGPT